MKKILLLFTLLLLPISLFAQGHYIIPDIGAPDMAIYVEMVAPHDQKGYFGNDGFYLPDIDNEVTISVTKNAQYVTFGPLVVSWEGRLVSTHIFVNKSANPTSILPDPAFQVEFEVSGTTVPSPRNFTFNIVKPQSLGINGDISGINEFVLGEGSLGVRSARGAMIVDSLTLKASSDYTFSTKDPDGDLTNGNQGYFPAILLSKGPIKGNNSTISVSAPSRNAGPGGGGGGGYFSDLPAGTGGSDGGSGFTSGGKGGTNLYISSNGAYKAYGQSTGANGYSFNGIESFDPVPLGGWEASYGGTGHPFGTIGSQALDGTNANTQGGYGGGSAYKNNTQGGAGSYATTGEGDNVTGGTTGGRVVGNSMIVPLAGGSGGASGNPQAGFPDFSVSSGAGGGGGGAVNLFATSIENLNITADGDDGGNGHDEADGGPGSGGATSVMAKIGLSNISLSADGGHNDGRDGGSGRVRIDGYDKGTPTAYTPNSASKYNGISTDTSHIIKPKHRLTGSHKSGDSLYVYMKSKTMNWTLYDSFSTGSVGWGINFNFPPSHIDEYYIVVIQKANLSVDDYAYSPGLVLSQAASNIFRFGDPKLYVPKDTSFDVVNCENVFYEDSIQIQSIGGDYAHINLQDLWAFGNKGFKVLNTGEYDISPQSPDSLFYIKFSYTKQAGQTGTITDTLFLISNKLGTDTNRIAVSINLNSPEITFIDADNNSEIDTLLLDNICIGDISNKALIIRNDSKFTLNDLSLKIKSNEGSQATDFTVNPATISNLLVSATDKVDVTFQDMDNNHFGSGVSVKLFVYSKECPDPIDSIVVFIKVQNSELAISEADNSLDFGSVPVGQTKDMSVTLTNIGDRPALIQVPNPVNAPFSLVTPAISSFPMLLNPVSIDPTAKIVLTYRFSPVTNDNFLDSTLFVSFADVSKNSCEAEKKMYLTGTSTKAQISFNDTLDFGILYECQTDSADAYIKNESGFLITIDTAGAKLVGGNLDHFQITNKPYTISQGGQNQFRIHYTPPVIPTNSGLKTTTLQFELDPTTGEIFEIFVKADIDTFLVDYSPGKPFDLGNIPVGFDVPPQQLTITNNGKLPRTLTSITQVIGSKLTITPVVPGLPVVIPPSGAVTFDVDISLTPADTGNFAETIIAEFEECSTELPVNVVAKGIEGKLEIVGNFNLGKVPPCFNLSEDVEFRNAGQADIRLDSVLIVDESGVEITRLNMSQTTLSGYDGTNGFKTQYNLYGNKVPFGKHTAKLIAYVFENGMTNNYPVEINYEVVSGLIITPNPVNFGVVNLNNIKTMTVNISKDTSAPFSATTDFNVHIDRANLVIPYFEYQFVSPNDIQLNIGDKKTKIFNIDFIPTVNQSYLDTLQLFITISGCEYNVPLVLNGSASEGDTLFIYAKIMNNVEPNIDNFHIPIYATLKSKDTATKTIPVQLSQLDIDFNKTVFFPMSLTNGSFITRMTDPALSILQIKMQTPVNVTNKGETILTELVGPTMLGNTKDNLIHLGSTPSITDSTGISKILAQSGNLNLTICEEGGQRLLEHTNGFNYSLLKANGMIQIKANLVEPGVHKIKLINLTGKSILIDEINRSKNDKNEYLIDFDTSELNSGVYYIVFETPSRFKTEKLIIIN